MTVSSFTPLKPTVKVSASSTSQGKALTTPGTVGSYEVRIYVKGSSAIFVDFAAATATASVGVSMPIPSGAIENFCISNKATVVNVVTASATSTAYFTTGFGI